VSRERGDLKEKKQRGRLENRRGPKLRGKPDLKSQGIRSQLKVKLKKKKTQKSRD